MNGSKWRWEYHPPEGREGGRLDFISPAGVVAATVFTNRDGPGHNWFVWDRRGNGGENSSAPSIDAAVREAEAAVKRWKQVTA